MSFDTSEEAWTLEASDWWW